MDFFYGRIAMSTIGLGLRFDLATRDFTDEELERVRSGRFCDTDRMRVARLLYVELQAMQWVDSHSREWHGRYSQQMLMA
jgi:hypothetical protein